MVGTGNQTGPDDGANAAAVQWFARMRSDARTPAEERRFRSWLEAAPEHEAAYAALTRSFETAGAFAEAPEIQAMREAALRRPALRRPALWRITSAPTRAAAAIAASLILALFLFTSGMPWIGGPERGVHETAEGVRTNAVLEDGTLATLAPDTRVIPMFTPEERRIRLGRGQAIFDVMPDPNRPFVVEVGDGEVVALGTEFDVRKQGDGFVVTLVEGKVEVSGPSAEGQGKSVRLKAGEQVSCGKDRISEVREVDLRQAISWRNGLLLPEDTPFVEFVDEFNRHSRYKLLIDRKDPMLGKLFISGPYRIDDPMQIIEELKRQGYKVWYVKDAGDNVRIKVYGGSSGAQ